MRLASVRALKTELLASAMILTKEAKRMAKRKAKRMVSFPASAARGRTVGRTMAGIALGVTVARKARYRLAVRLQYSGALISAMTEQIRQRAKGEVDVQYVGKIVKFPGVTRAAFYRQPRRPLRIGSSISDVHAGFLSAGTLGCFVVRRQPPYYIGMLTNNHVIANENGNATGSPVVQPGTLDRAKLPQHLVGELGKVVKLRKSATNFVDAAIGDLYEDIDYDSRRVGSLGNLEGLGNVVQLPAGAFVHKVGRTTGQTKGRITAFDVDNVGVEYDMGVLRFDDQIEIEGTGNRAFSDSGSLIVDDDRNAIGLLFAGGDEGGSNGKGLTYANPIGTVLDALKVDLEL